MKLNDLIYQAFDEVSGNREEKKVIADSVIKQIVENFKNDDRYNQTPVTPHMEVTPEMGKNIAHGMGLFLERAIIEIYKPDLSHLAAHEKSLYTNDQNAPHHQYQFSRKAEALLPVAKLILNATQSPDVHRSNSNNQDNNNDPNQPGSGRSSPARFN